LLSPEGINLFVAGLAADVDALLGELRGIPGLESLEPKVSETDHQPFNRMLVRLKKEIIAFGVDGIEPGKRTSPKLQARELKKWLDEGRPVTLLDTRNDYEVRLGTFRNALPIGVDTFRDFPAAVAKLPDELKETPIVMFCTGGIRCEKAGPFMEREGFKNIFQLDGGILKYFEECGGAHYDGECFVFDQRVGVDPSLSETDSTRCFACQSPLSAEEQADARYVPGKSCPYCFETPEQQRAASIAARMSAIAKAFNPLPGSVPHDNFKPVNIPQECHGSTLLAALSHCVKAMSPEQWTARFSAERVLDIETHEPVNAERLVRAGERFVHKIEQVIEPDVSADVTIIYEDEALIVLNKPRRCRCTQVDASSATRSSTCSTKCMLRKSRIPRTASMRILLASFFSRARDISRVCCSLNLRGARSPKPTPSAFRDIQLPTSLFVLHPLPMSPARSARGLWMKKTDCLRRRSLP
jgi:predicted sulfurtransferase